MRTGGASLPAKPDCAALDYPRYEPPAVMPSALEILPLLHSSPRVEEVSKGRLLIANEHFGLLLTREE